MTALFALAADYRAAAQQLADLELPPEVVNDTLESMAGELEVKAQSVAHVIRAIEADAAAMKEWGQQAIDRAKAAEARADRLREYLANNMIACGISRIEGPGVVLSFRKSAAVVITEPALVPQEYCTQPKPPEPSKTLIAKAIKEGKEVPGAMLESRQSLQIR